MRILEALALGVMVAALLAITGGLLFDVILTEPRLYP